MSYRKHNDKKSVTLPVAWEFFKKLGFGAFLIACTVFNQLREVALALYKGVAKWCHVHRRAVAIRLNRAPSFDEIIRLYHRPLYYFLIFNLFIIMSFWHLCVFFFIMSELLIFLVIPFVRHIWALRILVLFLFTASAYVHEFDHLRQVSDSVIIANVSYLTFGLLPADWMSDMNNSMVDMHWIAEFAVQYFFVVYLPFFLAIVIILAPLVSAASLLMFGHKIGYVSAGYFAVVCNFFAAVSSWYLWLVYPFLRADFISYFGKGGRGDLILRVEEDTQYISFIVTDPVVYNYLNMIEDGGFLLTASSERLHLPVNFGSFVNTPLLWGGFEFLIDSISLVMVATITLVSSLVHLYSVSYMGKDPHMIRFYALLSLFTFFMITLVMAGNMIVLYIGWEGVGLSSYLLISFWYTRVAAVKAAVKAMLVNKIGDMFLIGAMSIIIYFSKGSTTIMTIPSTVIARAAETPAFWGFNALDLLAVLIVMAAFVKSAQIFFHTWLADAMEGPTPVSALLHAATMVTAGVYLVIRFSPVVELSAAAKVLLIFSGLFTVIISSCIAAAQYDIKKIIAYSTCSQLGLMFFSCGFSGYDLALYHFFNHAFFKCALFLLAGVIIHELNNEQDIRRMGGLLKKMPFTAFCFAVASLSLVGFPGFSGSTSKDLILRLSNHTAFGVDDWYIFGIAMFFNISIYLTMLYSFRLFYYVFLAPVFGKRRCLVRRVAAYEDVSLVDSRFRSVFAVLTIMSIGSGAAFRDYFVVLDSEKFINIHEELFIRNHFYLTFLSDSNASALVYIMTIHALLIGLALIIFKTTHKSAPNVSSVFEKVGGVLLLNHNGIFYKVFGFFNRKCYFDEIYNLFIIRPILHLSYVFNNVFEAGVFNYISAAVWRLTFLPGSARYDAGKIYFVRHMHFAGFSLIALYVSSAIIAVYL